jgi:hypothetical protein
MGKVLGGTALVILVAGGVVNTLQGDNGKSSVASVATAARKSETKPALATKPESVIAVDAPELWRAYNANEVAADEKYKGKALLVAGEITSIDKDFLDNIVLRLKAPNEFMSTNAYMNEADKKFVVQLRKGHILKVRCTGGGMTLGSPVLRDCSID